MRMTSDQDAPVLELRDVSTPAVSSGSVRTPADPPDLGYLAAYTAAALVDGTITGKEGDTFKAGKLGEYKVGANGEVLLGDPTAFNSSNIDKFNF